MEEQFGNQTEQVEQDQVETTQQEQTEETPATKQDNYFTVKYNKEERQVSYDEAPDYIQKGMNYDKVNQRVSEYEQNLNKIAKMSGYNSHDELLQAVSEAEKRQEREQYEQAGIDPDKFNELLEKHPDVQYAREMKQKQEQESKFQSEANELFGEFPDLKADQIPNDVWQLRESKGLSLLDAYLRVNYKSLGQQKEQEALQKLQQNQNSSTGSLNGGEVEHNKSFSKMSKKDFDSIQQRVLRGERVQL